MGCNIERIRQAGIDIIEDFRALEVPIVEHLDRGRWRNQRRAQYCSRELLLKPNCTIAVAFNLHAAKHFGFARVQFEAGSINWDRASEAGLTSTNLPYGCDGNVRSLMLAITSPHSSSI